MIDGPSYSWRCIRRISMFCFAVSGEHLFGILSCINNHSTLLIIQWYSINKMAFYRVINPSLNKMENIIKFLLISIAPIYRNTEKTMKTWIYVAIAIWFLPNSNLMIQWREVTYQFEVVSFCEYKIPITIPCKISLNAIKWWCYWSFRFNWFIIFSGRILARPFFIDATPIIWAPEPLHVLQIGRWLIM